MEATDIFRWIENVGAQIWPNRSGYGTKGRGPILSWTCQVITNNHKVIQPTKSTLIEAIMAAIAEYGK